VGLATMRVNTDCTIQPEDEATLVEKAFLVEMLGMLDE
jgi:hypothetical protein